jgi:ABC-2 type transport system permease protein
MTTLALPGAHPSGLRSAVPGRWASTLVFAHRALLKLKHVPEQMIDAIAIPVLFTVLFTYLFGGALAGSIGDYLHALLPGTLVMAVLLMTVYTGLVLKTDLDRGVLDRFRSMPIWRPAVIVGSLLGDAGRYLLSATIVVALGLLMGFRPDGGATGVVLAVALVVVFAFSLSWVWTTLALVVRTPASLSGLSFIVQFPLMFASNVFVDPTTMPGWLRAFVTVNPVSLLVTTVRDLMHGTATADQIGWVLLASAALVAVFAPLTMHLYRTRS